jgi:hypothetical protein
LAQFFDTIQAEKRKKNTIEVKRNESVIKVFKQDLEKFLKVEPSQEPGEANGKTDCPKEFVNFVESSKKFRIIRGEKLKQFTDFYPDKK